jgi:hypothetical protein
LSELGSISFAADAGYGGNLITWLPRRVRTIVTAPADASLDEVLIAAIAGRPSESAVPVQWEGHSYTFDLAFGEAQRIRRFYGGANARTLEAAMRASEQATRLASSGDTTQAAGDAFASLLAASGPRLEHRNRIQPPPRSDRTNGAIAPSLIQAVDEVAAEALLALAYAAHWNEPDGRLRSDRGLPRRHDFGVRSASTSIRARGAWLAPRLEFTTGAPWRVAGSLLGLDMALAPLALRRTATTPPGREPKLLSTDRYAFAASLGAMDVFALRDSDAATIASAVTRGRQRVARLTSDSAELPKIIDEIRMDGWRARALRWSLTYAPAQVPDLFSLTDLLYLGGGVGAGLQQWGMSAISAIGCLCTLLPPPGVATALVGRPQTGLLPFAIPDLNLRVAVLLHDLQMPAALARSVLEAALYDLFANAQPAHVDDWLTLVRDARALSRDQVADYLAAATASSETLSIQRPARRVP